MIELDYKKDGELFNETAKKWADNIGGGVKNTQIRKFFDQVLELEKNSNNSENFEGEVLPFVKMLNSKVAYAGARKSAGGNLINQEFINMINSCVKQVNDPESLRTFKLFFEAVIGFHKSIEGSKK